MTMSTEKDNLLELNQYMKLDKMPYIIYADIESSIKKIDGCANNPENFLSIKIGEYIPCGYYAESIIRDYAKNIIDFEKKKMLPLTKKQLKSHQDARYCYICEKGILNYILSKSERSMSLYR